MSDFSIICPALQMRDPPNVILTQSTRYTFRSTVAASQEIHLYEADSAQLVVAKFADLREVQLHERVASCAGQQHPNVAAYVGVATLQGKEVPERVCPDDLDDLILLIQYANGGSLQQLADHALKHSYKLPARLCYHVLGCVVDALIYVQTKHGVQHEDVHLGNVTFDIKDGSIGVLLIDYGLVTVLPKCRNWEKELTSSMAMTARAIFASRDAFEAEFVEYVATIPVEYSNQKVSLDALRERRRFCLGKAGEGIARVEDVPVWLAQYFADLLNL